MARKSRYMGYMKELQKISKHEKTSTKESLFTSDHDAETGCAAVSELYRMETDGAVCEKGRKGNQHPCPGTL